MDIDEVYAELQKLREVLSNARNFEMKPDIRVALWRLIASAIEIIEVDIEVSNDSRR